VIASHFERTQRLFRPGTVLRLHLSSRARLVAIPAQASAHPLAIAEVVRQIARV
jgi:hypothetical protein